MSVSKRHENQIQRNRHQRVAGGDTLDNGNSGHLKREPYPFQMTDAIPRARIRVFYNVITSLQHRFNNVLTCCSVVRTLQERCEYVVNALLERC